MKSRKELIKHAVTCITDFYEILPDDINWSEAELQSQTLSAIDEITAVLAQFRSDPSLRSEYTQQHELEPISRAWEAGLRPEPLSRHVRPHLTMLDDLIVQTKTNPAYFDALSIVGANLLIDAKPIPYLMRDFMASILRGEAKRPHALNRNTSRRIDNFILCNAVEQLVDEFELTPTRNQVSGSVGTSACDIVADAMVALGRQPSRYDSIRKIWNQRHLYQDDTALH